jgi:hypothetical protein
LPFDPPPSEAGSSSTASDASPRSEEAVDPSLSNPSNNASPPLSSEQSAPTSPSSSHDYHIILPIHALQIPCISLHFPNAYIYPSTISLPALAQQSTRSILLAPSHSHLLPGLSLKLAINVKLTSAIRSISPKSAFLGARLCKEGGVLEGLKSDFGDSRDGEKRSEKEEGRLRVLKEVGSVVALHEEDEIGKLCAGILREWPASAKGCATSRYSDDLREDEEEGELLIVSTALMEWGHPSTPPGEPACARVFELDNEEKRMEWVDRYASFIFPYISNQYATQIYTTAPPRLPPTPPL